MSALGINPQSSALVADCVCSPALSAEEKEKEAMRLLEEVAQERHGQRCVLIHTELIAQGGTILELIDRAVSYPASSAAPACARVVACG